MRVKSRFTNENITSTVESNDLLTGSTLFATVQADYSLSAAEYMMLKSNWVSLHVWAMNIGFATFGFTLSLLPKVISADSGVNFDALVKGEWVALSIGVGVVVLLSLVGFCGPSEKKEIMKAIRLHFKNAPKVRQPVRG